jgi:hypothetical protein
VPSLAWHADGAVGREKLAAQQREVFAGELQQFHFLTALGLQATITIVPWDSACVLSSESLAFEQLLFQRLISRAS